MQVKEIQGVGVPEIGLGTYKLFGKECRRVVRTALDLGYRHIDTAQIYENEMEIGRAIRESDADREELFLTTKVWHTHLHHDDVLQSVEEILAALDTSYVDLLLIHWPNPQVPLEETFEAMMILRDQGKALNLGVSNFTLPMMKRVIEEMQIPIFCNQVEFHPYLVPFDLLEYSYEREFLVTAYCPLARGKVLEDPVIQEIARHHGKSPSQVALRWLIEQENVAAIPKSTSASHLESNLNLYDFELSDEHFQMIDELERGDRLVNPVFAPDWDA